MDVSRYQLNHPKAYLGYALSLYRAETKADADELTREYVTNGADMARRGAENLELVSQTDTGLKLTERGVWVASKLPEWLGCEDSQEAFEVLDHCRGARRRFVEQFPALQDVGPAIACGDSTFERLVENLGEFHDERARLGYSYALSTEELYRALEVADPEFGKDLLLVEDRKPGRLEYRSSTTFQLKTIGWHFGVFQEKGVQSDEHDPTEHCWMLEPWVLDFDVAPPEEFVPQPERREVA